MTEVEDLRVRLNEAEETLEAIQRGDVEAIVVKGPRGDRLFTFKGPDEPFRILVESMNQGALTLSADGKILYCNPWFADLMKGPVEEFIGLRFDALVRPDQKPLFSELLETARGDGIAGEITLSATDATSVPLRLSLGPLPVDTEGAVCVIAADMTAQKLIEAQLLQIQIMETAGKLAAGMAHEFNGILTAIIGHSELMVRSKLSDDSFATHATQIRQAADRAAVLTRQLLAFGRKQILAPESVDLNIIIANLLGSLRDLMGAAVAVRVEPGAGPQEVRVDVRQIGEAVTHMAVNAREAMPRGGTLTIETSNVTLGHQSLGEIAGRESGLKPGRYVVLAITDTGKGMTAATTARVFDPFFTTKEVGEGTGLGLATCYGILKQSGGHISVASELGKGTTFKIYLPQTQQPANVSRQSQGALELPSGNETILLVEDDPTLCEMAASILRRLGYVVHPSTNIMDALNLVAQAGKESVDLALVDVAVAQPQSLKLSHLILGKNPGMKILFTSAISGAAPREASMVLSAQMASENTTTHNMPGPGGLLLKKPFTPRELALKVREALDR